MLTHRFVHISDRYVFELVAEEKKFYTAANKEKKINMYMTEKDFFY